MAPLPGRAVDVAAIISNALAECIHNGNSLIFPCLITSLCRERRAYIPDDDTIETKLRSPITGPYITTHCSPKPLTEVLKKLRDQNRIPKESALEPESPPALSDREMLLQMQAQLDRQNQQQKACYTAITGFYQSFHSIYGSRPDYVGLPYSEYLQNNKWPEDMPTTKVGESNSRQGAQKEPEDDDGDDYDAEDMDEDDDAED
ncbi:uncharacterized protein LOC130748502 [Lotus japonicus]|uniref:uncharacterized protein LOC130748502 n=1 Tax=Lotus japonicus TaxID=34305 RepID=UPI00258FDE82|nr:uncharacterized protein LOC130748502 [Lotus japonicus]XP_057457717.1 uncharacterized protein LOC130748502 [Lotus japonicus]